MSPHLLGAKLNDYYPKPESETPWGTLANTWRTYRLRLKNTEAVLKDISDNPDRLVSGQLYAHGAEKLGKTVTEVFNTAYGKSDYDTAVAMQKNVRRFAAHKSAYFTEWIRNKAKEEKQAVIAIFQRQLVTEGNLASRASRAAKQWQHIGDNKGKYPQLEYLPSRSVAKRENHTKYYGMILPVEHAFWNTGLPPNGWNCKCRVKQTDATATKALTPPKPVKGIAGNAGKEKVVFSAQHPFFRNVSQKGKNKILKEWRKLERTRVAKWALDHKNNIRDKAFQSQKGKIRVNRTGIRKIVNQPHGLDWEKNQLLYDIKEVIRQAEYIKAVEFKEEKKGIRSFSTMHYFRIKIQGKDNYLVVRELNEKQGGEKLLYSIVDSLIKK